MVNPVKNAPDRRIWMAAGLGALILICAFVVFRSTIGSSGQDQANVADIAKSIDHTKANTPSVPEEKLKLGFGGGKHPVGLGR